MSDSVGSVSVDVVPDARGWAEKLRAQIRDTTVKVKADADTAEANAKLDKTARNRTAKINVKVDKGAKVLDDLASKMSILPALFVAAGAAAIPLVATLGALTAAIAAPLAIAGGGAALFGVFSAAAIKQTLEQSKNVAKLKAQADAAQVSLDNARRSAGKNAATSTSVANAQERLNKATAAYQAALKGVSPQQAQFVKAIDGLKTQFGDMIHGPTGRSILAVLSDGVNLLTYMLRASGPIIRAASGAFSDLFGSLQQAINSPGFEQWVHRMARQVGPDIVAFGHILGNLGEGLGGLFGVLDGSHFSGGVLKGLEQITQNFADWGNSKAARHDVREFFSYVHEVGPQVAHTLGALAHASGAIIKALAPLGPKVLAGIEGLPNVLSAMPTPVLTALGGALIALTLFAKAGGFKAVGALSSVLGGGLGKYGGKSIVPVYVTNAGMIGGGGSGLGGFLGKVGKYAGPGTLLGAGIGVAGVASVAAATAFGLWKVWQAESSPGRGALSGGMTPAQHLKYDQQRIADMYGLPNPYTIDARIQSRRPTEDPLRSTVTHLDALHSGLARASRSLDLIGPHADAAFGAASKDVDRFVAKLNAIHDKQLKVVAQTDEAIRRLQQLQAFQIRDKSFNVYQRQLIIERQVGPGGGMGQLPHGGTPLHVHVSGHIDQNGYVSGTAQKVYDQNRAFEAAHQ